MAAGADGVAADFLAIIVSATELITPQVQAHLDAAEAEEP